MKGLTITGFLKIKVDITTQGPLSKKDSDKIEAELLEFFKERKLNVRGEMSHITINTSDLDNNYSNYSTDI